MHSRRGGHNHRIVPVKDRGVGVCAAVKEGMMIMRLPGYHEDLSALHVGVKNRAPILSLLIRRMPQRADAGKPPRVFPCCPANGSSAFLPVRGWCPRTSRKTVWRRRGQYWFRATGSFTACRKPTGPTIPTSIIQFRMIRRMCRWITLPGFLAGIHGGG